MNPIAVNIKNLRREKGLSQEQFAQALHVTRQTVSAWERGVSQPGLDTLGEMARVLEVEPERLLYGSPGKKRPAYRAVSFWPVVGIIPLFYFMVFWVLPTLLSLMAGTYDNTVFLLGGQLFLAIVAVFCYCSLKDEIRNREYYQKEEEEKADEESPGEEP